MPGATVSKTNVTPCRRGLDSIPKLLRPWDPSFIKPVSPQHVHMRNLCDLFSIDFHGTFRNIFLKNILSPGQVPWLVGASIRFTKRLQV